MSKTDKALLTPPRYVDSGPCHYCDDGDDLDMEWATEYQCIDLSDAMFEIEDGSIVISVNETIDCEECGRSKTLTGYANIHTWEVE